MDRSCDQGRGTSGRMSKQKYGTEEESQGKGEGQHVHRIRWERRTPEQEHGARIASQSRTLSQAMLGAHWR